MKKQKQAKKDLILSFVFPLLTLMEIFISHEISSASRGREGAGEEIVREGLDLPEAACFLWGLHHWAGFPAACWVLVNMQTAEAHAAELWNSRENMQRVSWRNSFWKLL